MTEPRSPAHPAPRFRPPAAAAALGLAFFLLYLGTGLVLHRDAFRLFQYMDQAFDADTPKRIIDLTRSQGPHDRTQFHPLFLLLLNPLGSGLRDLLRLAGVTAAGHVASIVLTAVAGGLSVALFFVLLRRLGITVAPAGAWAAVYGLSATALVFGVLPESWSFSALSLLVLFVVGTRRNRSEPALVAAGVAAFGMVVTNLGAVALVRATRLSREPRALLRFAGHLAAVIAVAAALSLVQGAFHPGVQPFFSIERLDRDDRLSFEVPRTPAAVVGRATELAAHLVLWNLAAPTVTIEETGTPRTVVDFPLPSLRAWRPAGVLHALLWLPLLGLAAAGLSRGGLTGGVLAREPMLLALLGWLAFHAAFHLVFGPSLFLYSPQWTFAVVALAAVGVDQALEELPHLRPVVGVGLAAAAVLQAVANLTLLFELRAIFAG